MRWIALLFLFTAPALYAQSKPDLLAVDSAFIGGQYDQTEILALRLLSSRSDLTADEIARLNLTAGYAVIMLAREDDARLYFARALDAVPTLTLDPVAVSPKFRVVFDEVKAKHEASRNNGEYLSDTLYRPNANSKTAVSRIRAQLLNLALPGSGQWLTGSKIRGASFFVLQAASAGYLIYQVGQLRDSREKYLAEDDPLQMKSAYRRYNRDYNRTWAAGIATGVIYIAAQADLIWRAPHSQTALMLAPVDANKLALVLRW